jgi:hypothetical protein
MMDSKLERGEGQGDGDALRLYTCAFVSDSLQALIFGLVGM